MGHDGSMVGSAAMAGITTIVGPQRPQLVRSAHGMLNINDDHGGAMMSSTVHGHGGVRIQLGVCFGACSVTWVHVFLFFLNLFPEASVLVEGT